MERGGLQKTPLNQVFFSHFFRGSACLFVSGLFVVGFCLLVLFWFGLGLFLLFCFGCFFFWGGGGGGCFLSFCFYLFCFVYDRPFNCLFLF